MGLKEIARFTGSVSLKWKESFGRVSYTISFFSEYPLGAEAVESITYVVETLLSKGGY